MRVVAVDIDGAIAEVRTHVPANNLELVHADILSLSSIERDDWSERITFVSAICHITLRRKS